MRNNAAKVRKRVIIMQLPFHLVYLTLFIIGVSTEMGAYCHEGTPYPFIFFWQFGFFILTYFYIRLLVKNDFFLVWNDALVDMKLEEVADFENMKDRELSKKARVKILYLAQVQRYLDHYRWLIKLVGISMITVLIVGSELTGYNIGCDVENNTWVFKACWARHLTYILHCIPCMQAARMASHVFVVTVKKTSRSDLFKSMETVDPNQIVKDVKEILDTKESQEKPDEKTDDNFKKI
jgi:hypothetical protein